MFKKEKTEGHFAAESISIIAANMKVTGDVKSENDMRIDGEIEGNIYCKARVVLGHSGKITGDLHANNADIFGAVTGVIETKDQLCLKAGSSVIGEMNVGRLNIEPGANYNGKCSMMHEQQIEDVKKVASHAALSY